MFTGIVEKMVKVKSIIASKNNLIMEIYFENIHELTVDQSISHNGACLTVTKLNDNSYQVDLIEETIQRTNFKYVKAGDFLNLERSLKIGDRLDGHMVQGHVDTTAKCTSIEINEGSWKYFFKYDDDSITVEKGSITVNGVSLTVVDSLKNAFSVCIIPYTYEHTNFKYLKINDYVNIEFDILGKYIKKLVNDK